MRRVNLLALLVLPSLVAALVAPAAMAQDDDDPSAAAEYFSRVGRNMRAGLNGLITFPADAVAFTAEGDEIFEELPGAAFTGRLAGFGGGLLQGLYRAMTGVGDLVFSPLPAMPMLSPLPRYTVIPYTHDNE